MTDVIQLPARNIPLPGSISMAARQALLQGASRDRPVLPPLEDLEAWRRHIREVDASIRPALELFRTNADLVLGTDRSGSLDIYKAHRSGLPEAQKGKVNLLLHGGAFVYVTGELVSIPAAASALSLGGLVYAPDYRTPPDHPFPEALDDCLAAYRHVLQSHAPEDILVSGESAGGNLAAALMHRAKDEGLPAPRALYLNTPVTDLTGGSDSVHINQGADVVLSGGIRGGSDLYAGDHDREDPLLSPIFGSFESGFPPTYVRTGTRDLLLSDSVRIHAALRKAGVPADLYVGEAMPHGGFAMMGVETPEDVDAREDLLRWLAKHWLGLV